ncbi:VOC family protein, partial [Streptomyces atriruber]
MTTLHWKLVIDANDPHAQAAFWAETLGYEVEDNSALIERLLGLG